MKNVTVRHNKNYDSVLINNNSVEAYKEAVEVAKKLDLPVIRITRKAYKQYIDQFKPFDKIKNRESFTIFGVKFEYIKDSETDDAIWYKRTGLKYDYKKRKLVVEPTIIGYAEDYSNLIEDVFLGVTGSLLN